MNMKWKILKILEVPFNIFLTRNIFRMQSKNLHCIYPLIFILYYTFASKKLYYYYHYLKVELARLKNVLSQFSQITLGYLFIRETLILQMEN